MKKLFLGLVVLIALVLLAAWLVGSASFVKQPQAKATLNEPNPGLAATDTAGSEILFGDLHVHSNYSMDAAIFSTPMMKNTGYRTPVDACHFARYCAGLDFWSINDHAEGLAPWQWQATKEAVRQCNANADSMVAFLGWEWSQGGPVDSHWGHKNVILRGLADDEVPTRPIGSGDKNIWRVIGQSPAVVRGLALMAMSRLNLSDYQTLAQHLQSTADTPPCASGDVRELGADCHETASTPQELFERLDQWGFDALVIPHGLAWGTTNPTGADFQVQMNQLNSRYQRLLEVYSGHGNSEVYRDLEQVTSASESCAAPSNGYMSCCWRAGEIIENRCRANGGNDCTDRAAETRRLYLEAVQAGSPLHSPLSVVPGANADDWGQCDQLVGAFQPAHNYQPRQSAQYILGLGDKDSERFRPGFIAASDIHTARPGIGYKETARFHFTDTKDTGRRALFDPSADRPQEVQKYSMFDVEDGKDAFYFTGGLVAVHSNGRDRDAIWDALYQRRVYGTSGPRIKLWFELEGENGSLHPMGSELKLAGEPIFRVRAQGSLKQLPGCPDHAVEALGEAGVADLCRNECNNPGNEAYRIERIEVVRIRPRQSGSEPLSSRIDDPWKVLPCESAQQQCEVSFSDPAYAQAGQETLYYVRAIQEASVAIQGDPMNCQFDENGQCVQTNYCLGVEPEENCLSPTQHRAWSSPIYLNP